MKPHPAAARRPAISWRPRIGQNDRNFSARRASSISAVNALDYRPATWAPMTSATSMPRPN